jgi:TPR repeat protein
MITRNQPIKRLPQPLRFGGHPGFREYNKSLKRLGNDDEEAFRLNAIAADEGMHDAVLAMGWFYLNGAGVEANLDEAIRWYKKAARFGDLRAFFSLGQIAYVQKDFDEAILWLKRSADKGHLRSKFYLGKLYWRGDGVDQDKKLARQFFAEAAAGNVFEAQRTERFLSFLGSRTV